MAFIFELLRTRIVRANHILDVAPHTNIRQLLAGRAKDAYYVGMDYFEPDRNVELFADLTQLPFRDGSFDIVLCVHVLEHIPEDHKAIAEIARVLTPEGTVILAVPWRANSMTIEDPSASPEERAKRFGQADHVRYYGNDLEARLYANGLWATQLRSVDVLDEDSRAVHGVNSVETLWLCSRTGKARPYAPWPLPAVYPHTGGDRC